MKRRLFLSLILLGLSFQLFAQKILEFDAFSIEDGFASSKANVIIQDSKGFVWIGTWNGLNRYDGVYVRTF